MIEIEDLAVSAGGTMLLRDVTLELQPGRVTALLGPNGAGKSTLLRVVGGDTPPLRGCVRLNGRPIYAGDSPRHGAAGRQPWTRREQAQRRAVMLQDSSLSFPFPALDVVLMGRAPHIEGVERRRDRDIARATLGCVQAGTLQSRLYPTLSGGEKQRVQMARALAQVWEPLDGEPRHLLLDEPTSSLDPRHQHVVLAQVRRFADEGGCVLIVLHDLNLAARYADDIVLLKDGAVVAHGAAATTLTEANLRAAFDLQMRVLRAPDLDFPLVYSGGAHHDASQPEPH